jgi:hypothetical protein
LKSRKWVRAEVIEDIRGAVWRHVTQAAREEGEMLLEAAALLQMPREAVRVLGLRQFLLSTQVKRLIDDMPALIRRLATTTTRDEEWSAERLRGPVDWGITLSARGTTGLRHFYVTSPARRAYQTPENEILVAALDAVRSTGHRIGWHQSDSVEVGRTVRDRVTQADEWLARRSLSDVERRPITPRAMSRVRSGRHARRYTPAVDVYRLYEDYVRRLDRASIRQAVERHAVAATADDVLLELLCGFRIEEVLKAMGWKLSQPGLVGGGGRFLHGRKGDEELDVYYQHVPPALGAGSIYGEVQAAHGFSATGALAPDFVLRHSASGASRWLVVEVKGVQRDVTASARAALLDLLAYRRAFEPVLANAPSPYGLGIAWGAELEPSSEREIALCSPDQIGTALEQVLPGGS